MCFVKINNEKKKEFFICYKYFAVLCGSFFSTLKQSNVTSNKNPRINHYKIINSYVTKQRKV